MAKIIRRHYEKDKNVVVFPLSVVWMNHSPLYITHTSRLEIHFLWWHWGWTIERGKKDGN